MKARIKHTQQIIDVEWNIRGWIWDGPEGKRIFAEEELVFLDNDCFDWQSFRVKAAKDILCALLSNPNETQKGDIFQLSHTMFLVDELIKQLKEKGA